MMAERNDTKMAIITFWNNTDEQCGNTSSSLAFATQMAIKHNVKVLLLSTALNDRLIKESFWYEKKQKRSGLFGPNTSNNVEKNGIEGLDRTLRSNKITPEIVTDYTRIALTDRLEILLSFEGEKKAYDDIKQRFHQTISLASKYYNLVIVDLDKEVGEEVTKEILKISDIVVAMTSQRAKDVKKVSDFINSGEILKPKNYIMAIGKYNATTKYNAKNISRNILKQKNIINTIPYNNLFFEAEQEGKIIDLFMMFMNIKEKDANYEFVQEINKLIDEVQMRLKMLQMKM